MNNFKKISKRITAILLCLVMLLPLAACKDKEETPEEPSIPAADTVVMSTENFSLSYAEFNYIFFRNYNQFVNSYAQQIGDNYASVLKSYMGLDINASLKGQTLSDNSDTYFNYFLEIAKSEATDVLLFCEYAKSEGLTVSEELKKSNEESVAAYEKDAADNGLTISEYMGDTSGYITKEVLASYADKQTLAGIGYEHQQASHTYTDDQISKEFADNPKSYALASYLAYAIQPDDGNVTEETANTSAEALAATKDEASFKAYVSDYYTNVLNKGNDKATAFDPESIEYNNISYGEGTKYLDWIFDGAKVGETFVVTDEKTKAKTVYMLTKEPGENEYDLKDVRHILFLSESFTSTEACKKKAEEVLAIYEKNPTEENFIALVKEYSEDTGSNENGGLYENIDYNEMVADFENWCFDESRTAGETGIVFTTYGYHIMYFVGNGDHVRKGFEAAKEGLRVADYEKDYKAFEEKYPITSDEELMKQIDA